MKVRNVLVPVLGALLLLVTEVTSFAGVYSDDLARCMVGATSVEDRRALVVWLFSAGSLHPAVKSITAVSPEQLDNANKQVADIVMRLLTDSCVTQAREAIKFEGKSVLESSFGVLGQVAGRELFSSPEVGVAMQGMAKYLDAVKLKQSLVEK
ncbi:hypothetical protein L4X63_02150 [Geomonas sp. Red32]|nr:hypothetical protein [Geomonas sp. Red32]